MNENSRIRVLPDLIVNKIAAGEVVERPASVVKELMDNAIDAGATRIALTIEDGGKQLIRVTDDGCGMRSDELLLSVTPHATSKITCEDDLYSITTMGFRGEALASISAIAKLRIVSRARGTDEGYAVEVTGEQLKSALAAGSPVGSSVEVRDLFYNIPARRKFLRTRATETGHINEQVTRSGLAFPDIAFEVRNNGRVSQNSPSCTTRLARIRGFFSEELGNALLPIEREERGIELEIYVAPPAQSRASSQWQYVFVNGRFIRDRYISHAIKEAYRGLVDPNRHGIVFLFLTINPKDVDVNVHPTKIEVRWADSNLIHSQVLSAIRETFQRSNLTAPLRTDRAAREVDPAAQDRIRREMADMFKSATPVQPAAGADRGLSSRAGSPHPDSWPAAHSASSVPSSTWRSLYETPGESTQTPGSDDSSKPFTAADRSIDEPSNGPAVQLHNLYLVGETEDGIVIIDQHALHERIVYEQLKARLITGPLEGQRLLLAESIRIQPGEWEVLEANVDLLERLGIEVTRFGQDTVAIQSIPTILKDADVADFFRDLLDFLAQQASETEPEAVLHGLLDMMACKAAVRAGDPLTKDEINALMNQRHLVDKASSCPHGRPTTLHLSKAELNRQFKRT
ncbi:MAG: DNA mismatch repair endonuclease MutL [Planctomycetes bacterium]|nr:DNA mismatch repair endonuclease MutL [Planctomycetota bacterium]